MRRKFIITVALILVYSVTITLAQTGAGRNIADHLLIKEAKKNLGTEGVDDTVEGSPYLNDTFLEGKIYFDKEGVTIIPIRYNIYQDWLEFQQNGHTYVLDASERIKKVLIGDQTFIVEKYSHKAKSKLGYFTLLDTGKLTLLSKQTMTFKERQEPKALETEPKPAKYSRSSDDYYYKLGNDEVKKIENLKDMIGNLPSNQEDLTQFVKKEKISPRKKEELLKLVRHYNTLN